MKNIRFFVEDPFAAMLELDNLIMPTPDPVLETACFVDRSHMNISIPDLSEGVLNKA